MLFGRGVLAEIGEAAAATPDVEVCGLLLGTLDRVDAAWSCANVATDPATAFEIDPAALIAALRVARHGGPRVVGCYHSHPRGPALPSVRDAAEAAADGWLWLIVGDGDVALFRAVDSGPIHGRFAPLTVIPAQAGTHLLGPDCARTAGDGSPPARG